MKFIDGRYLFDTEESTLVTEIEDTYRYTRYLCVSPKGKWFTYAERIAYSWVPKYTVLSREEAKKLVRKFAPEKYDQYFNRFYERLVKG